MGALTVEQAAWVKGYVEQLRSQNPGGKLPPHPELAHLLYVADGGDGPYPTPDEMTRAVLEAYTGKQQPAPHEEVGVEWAISYLRCVASGASLPPPRDAYELTTRRAPHDLGMTLNLLRAHPTVWAPKAHH
jgi:hypothetical protein